MPRSSRIETMSLRSTSISSEQPLTHTRRKRLIAPNASNNHWLRVAGTWCQRLRVPCEAFSQRRKHPECAHFERLRRGCSLLSDRRRSHLQLHRVDRAVFCLTKDCTQTNRHCASRRRQGYNAIVCATCHIVRSGKSMSSRSRSACYWSRSWDRRRGTRAR